MFDRARFKMTPLCVPMLYLSSCCSGSPSQAQQLGTLLRSEGRWKASGLWVKAADFLGHAAVLSAQQITEPLDNRGLTVTGKWGVECLSLLGSLGILGDCGVSHWTGCLPVWWGVLMDEKGADI